MKRLALVLLLLLLPLQSFGADPWGFAQAGGGGSGNGASAGGAIGSSVSIRTTTTGTPLNELEFMAAGTLWSPVMREVTDTPTTVTLDSDGNAGGCWSDDTVTGQVEVTYTYGANCLGGTYLFQFMSTIINSTGSQQTFHIGIGQDSDAGTCAAYTIDTGNNLREMVIEAGEFRTLSFGGFVTLDGTGTTSCVGVVGSNDVAAELDLEVRNIQFVGFELKDPIYPNCAVAANEDWSAAGRLGDPDCQDTTLIVGEVLRGGLIHNRDAVGAVEIELPAIAQGDQFMAMVVENQTLCLDPGASDSFLFFGGTDGEKVCSSTAGSVLSCISVNASLGGTDWACTGAGWADGGA